MIVNPARAVPSPLRYPGGKARLGPWIAWTMRQNGLEGGVFAEPYCGGAGAAIYLLTLGYVSRIEINDLDAGIAAFWRSAIRRTREFTERIRLTEITLDERQRQLEVLSSPDRHSDFDLGWATWFLNRVNRSGIIRGGPIGGMRGESRYRLDVRFNRADLIRRIERIGSLSDRIGIHQMDGMQFVERVASHGEHHLLTFLDPPYVHKSDSLYYNRYTLVDHVDLAVRVRGMDGPWVMTYDDCAEIAHLYRDLPQYGFDTFGHAGSHEGSNREIRSERLIYGNLQLPFPPVCRKTTMPYPAGHPSTW